MSPEKLHRPTGGSASKSDGEEDPMTMLDLGPAAQRMADLVSRVPDDALGRPTPCENTTLGDLLDHVRTLSAAFTAAAKKTNDMSGPPPKPDAAHLGDDWRTSIPAGVTSMAEAWQEADAWTGMTRAGGLDLPAEIAGLVALDELVIHGWDVARASGQPFECDEPALKAVHQFVQQFSSPEMAAQRTGLFGPVMPVEDDAPLLDRVIGLAGRDPNWRGA
jgi:uncharacterized protein (TIGR03086 family)